jgi:hypothetical protein
MTSVQIRFQKIDVYDNLVFIASSKSLDESEVKACKKLKSVHKKLKKVHQNSYLPVYYSSETGCATLKFKNWQNLKCKVHDVYDINFRCLVTKRDDTHYIRVVVNSIDFLRAGVLLGTEIDINGDDSDDDSDDGNVDDK